LSAVLKELSKLQGSTSGAGRPQHVRAGAEEKRDAANRLKKSFVQLKHMNDTNASLAQLGCGPKKTNATVPVVAAPKRNNTNATVPLLDARSRRNNNTNTTFVQLSGAKKNATNATKKKFIQLSASPISNTNNTNATFAQLERSFVQLSQDEAEVQAFIEMATEADQHALRTLLDAIRKIRGNVQTSYNDDVAHEKKSLTTYNILTAILIKDNRRLNAMIVEETRNHKLYVRRVAELIVKIAQTRKLRLAKIAEKAATIKERLAKEAKYLADKAQRDEERRVIKRIEAIVVRRLANMSKYLNSNI